MADENNPAAPTGQDTQANAGAAPDGGVAASGNAVPGGGKLPSTAASQGGAGQEEPALLPPVDVIEDAGGITLYADLPGVSRDSLTLQLERDRLTVEGRLALDIPPEMQSHFAEVRLERYRRVFALSKELDGEQTSAELKNGVLKLRIPKAQHAQPRKIAITVA
ncbi:Hsp20 family protein [Massilia jejuensis]|uniref:Hsp20 family protein n=1 Tax=Massilia jejuensis TaxID=648894 RepID=A0ABW0PJS1_9BURK